MTRFVGFVLFLAALLLTACGEGAADVEVATVEPRPVRTFQVLPVDGAELRLFTGRTASPLESVVSFQVAGRIAERGVDIGDRVSRGARIARLDPTDYRLRVDEASAALVEAEARARNATTEYQRVRALYANDTVAKSALDTALAAYEGTAASLVAAERRVELARTQLGYTDLRARASGVVTDVLAEPGENVGAGQAIVHIATGDELEVEVAVPETLIADIEVDKTVEVRITALDDARFPATVIEVGAAPRSGATSFPVNVRLDGEDARLRTGMAAEVSFLFAATDRVVVPAEAVSADDRGRFVWVVRPETESATPTDPAAIDEAPRYGRVMRQPVEVGALAPDGLEILSGLMVGEVVVSAGVGHLEDDQRVRLLEHDPLAEIAGF
ncbi:MAG: efflux RND transporter periplasmic adaptor subunit [Acidobacteriota bacterium]